MLRAADTIDLVNGMSQELPAHLGQGTWWYTMNARFRHGRITQQPVLRPYILRIPADATNVTNISGFSTRQIAISGVGLYTLNFSNEGAFLVAQPAGFSTDSTNLYRWAVVQSQAGTYYVNPANPILFYDGATCDWNYGGSGPDYKGKYLLNFYGHLVVANVTDGSDYIPMRIAYSDIQIFDDFEPTITNEADFYDLLEDELNAVYGLGITGLHQIGNLMVIFTSGAIWNARYVGFDNGVMSFNRQIHGIGNIFPYASVSFDRYAIFITAEDFYVYDGVTAQPIGGPIRDYFFSTLSTDPEIRARTWSFVETKFQEIKFFYPTTESTGECDGCVVFNWQTKSWYAQSGLNRTSALDAGGVSIRVIDQLDFLEPTIDDLDLISSTIDGLDMTSVWPKTLYGVSNQPTISSESIPPDEVVDGTPQITLESRDFLLGELGQEKELQTILISATFSPFNPDDMDKAGWEVYISTRKYIHSPVNYQFVGIWKGTESEMRFTDLRTNGRIYRFKFVTRNLYDCQFFSFSPYFDAGATEN